MAFKENVLTALNNQINMELSAFYTYLGASAYFEAQGLRGFAAWMRHHANEEMVRNGSRHFFRERVYGTNTDNEENARPS